MARRSSIAHSTVDDNAALTSLIPATFYNRGSFFQQRSLRSVDSTEMATSFQPIKTIYFSTEMDFNRLEPRLNEFMGDALGNELIHGRRIR